MKQTKLIIWIPLIISAVALFCSMRSCYISEKAFDLSEIYFELNKRPYIVIVAQKLKGRYVKIIKTGNGLGFKIEYVLKNLGSTPAYDIKIEECNIDIICHDKYNNPANCKINYNFPPKTTLGPGQPATIFIDYAIPTEDNLVSAKNQFSEGKCFPFNMTISYQGRFHNRKKTYYSSINDLIFSDRVIDTGSEMK